MSSGGMPDHLGLVQRATQQHQLITVRDVRRLGISAHRWRVMRDEGWWIPVSPSHFRHASTPLTLELRARAGLGWLGPHALLFGTTALWWMGLDIDEPARPEFVVPRRQRSVITGMEVHTSIRLPPVDISRHRGLRTTTGARAIIDMMRGDVSVREVEDIIDCAVAARRTSLPTLRRRLAALQGKGQPGCPLLRELLLDSGGESYLERRFLRLVRTAGLPTPECQVAFRASSGKPLRVDFRFGRVIVEVSGRLGHSTDRDRQRSGRRKVELEDQGCRVIEFTTADVIDDPPYVLRTLGTALNVTISPHLLQRKL